MTDQSERATCIDAFLPRTTPSYVDTEIENRQNYSMSIMVVLFPSIIHGIALHRIAEVRKEWRGCVYHGFFLPLGLGVDASFCGIGQVRMCLFLHYL